MPNVLRRPGGGLALASRCPGAGRGARWRAGGSLACWGCLTGATGAGCGRGSTGVGNVLGADNAGVAGTGSETESTSGIGTGAAGDSSGAGGVGSDTGITTTGIVAGGSKRGQASRHACQPNDITTSPTTWSMRAVRKGANKDVCITRLASFQA